MNESALEGFIKIVELNSFSAAAEALYLSQSALSQQILTLEGQLQFELFQHVPRRVVLTRRDRIFTPRQSSWWLCISRRCATPARCNSRKNRRNGIW